MLNGLDLFSGIGGISKALDEWVHTVAYCEQDRYAQAVLLSRMAEGKLHAAPIWDDVTSLKGSMLPTIDIIFGGFPCQDISVAGNGVGLDGKRSGLFFEIMRLSEEIKPTFIFLENVPAIRTRGLDRVIKELSNRGYDSRWCALSAEEIGANHKRNRWFLLAANSMHSGRRQFLQPFEELECKEAAHAWRNGETQSLANSSSERLGKARRLRCDQPEERTSSGSEVVADTDGSTDGTNARAIQGICDQTSQRADEALPPRDRGKAVANAESIGSRPRASKDHRSRQQINTLANHWWAIEPDVGRVVNGLPRRVDRIKCLGNAVVPAQAKQAFMQLMGMK